MAVTSHNRTTVRQTEEAPQDRIQRIHDELSEKLQQLTANYGWAVPRSQMIVSEKVNGVFQTDQSYPWDHPDWSAIAVHPRFAALKDKDENVLRLAIAEAMARNALKIDRTLHIARKGQNQTVPQDVLEEVVGHQDFTNQKWAADKNLPLAALFTLSDPGRVAKHANALQRRLASQLLENHAHAPIWKLHKEMQAKLDSDPRLPFLKRLARKITRFFYRVHPTKSSTQERIDRVARGVTKPIRRAILGHIDPAPNDQVFAGQRPAFQRRQNNEQTPDHAPESAATHEPSQHDNNSVRPPAEIGI